MFWKKVVGEIFKLVIEVFDLLRKMSWFRRYRSERLMRSIFQMFRSLLGHGNMFL